MGRPSRDVKLLQPFDERFEMTRISRGDHLSHAFSVWSAVDRNDGETYVLWLLEKTGAAVDRDITRVLRETVRRLRGVLARRSAREVLIEVVDVVEDRAEIGIRSVGADKTLDALTPRFRQKLADSARTVSGRLEIWQQIARLVRALGYLHGADIVHGGITNGAVFVVSIEPLELKLGGYEACVHVGTLGDGGASLLGANATISHAQDWRDLGAVAAELLQGRDGGSVMLLPSEQGLLDRLCRPPQFAHINAETLASEIETLCAQLARVGSSGRYELVVAPGRDLLRLHLPALTDGLIPATDNDALVQFLGEDLNTEGLLMLQLPGDNVKLYSQRAMYDVRPLGDERRIGRIVEARPRDASQGTINASPIGARIHVAQNMKEARDRVARTGGGAMTWPSAGRVGGDHLERRDVAEWHALILIEIMTLLEGRLRHYPIEIVDTTMTGLVQIAARSDAAHDEWRSIFGLGDAATALDREMSTSDGSIEWTLTESEALSIGAGAPTLLFDEVDEKNGRRLYTCYYSGKLPVGTSVLLRPRPDRGTEASVRRRLRHIAAARDNLDLLRALGDPRSVGLDPALRDMAPPGPAPDALDASKAKAWAAIDRGHSMDLVVGPPGVGKTFLVSHLVTSILSCNPMARILITAQNHEALAQMERELGKQLANGTASSIIVRVERPGDREETTLRDQARSLLGRFNEREASPLSLARRQAIAQMLQGPPANAWGDPEADAILRDTEHLVLNSADVVLATANSAAIEEMVTDGQQFDWVIIEEAARASASELVGPLQLGSRRVLIGDHRQLAPFDAERKARLYQAGAAEALLEGAVKLLDAISDLPEEVGASLEALKADPTLMADVLATALRLEQPFREIAQTSEENENVSRSGPVSMLTEQSRMHPTICELVSETFYGGRLTTSERIQDRTSPIKTIDLALQAPVVIIDLPALSKVPQRAFETYEGTSLSNLAEVAAVEAVLDRLHPASADGKPPSLVVLSPYTAQCELLRARLSRRIDRDAGLLGGFSSAKDDGTFVHTIDSFQGGEADLVIVSMVRNNQKTGRRALGILGDRRRMNVLLSRARHKLVLVTSRAFLSNAVQRWSGHTTSDDLDFMEGLLRRIAAMAQPNQTATERRVSLVTCDASGEIVQ
ncbi:AAA domain-containing protein [Paracoccus sp. P2]|uniref:DEAD/DEAH box helicase n=1 Tax=Paracoccus sp. P2 TaxID=3248840 RepID=UPI00391FAADF